MEFWDWAFFYEFVVHVCYFGLLFRYVDGLLDQALMTQTTVSRRHIIGRCAMVSMALTSTGLAMAMFCRLKDVGGKVFLGVSVVLVVADVMYFFHLPLYSRRVKLPI